MTDEYDKDNAQDFVLWKASKPGEPVWKAPFGKGRPGWHLECSAMSMKYLGKSFDIHAGAVDLIFPHHENEIAQSEGATEKPFVKYWLHAEHLMVDGAKMAKSANNFFTLTDLKAKGFSPLVYRFFTLGAHYRSKINCTDESLQAAASALDRLYETVRVWNKPNKPSTTYLKQFGERVNDDLDMPGALAVVWQLVKDEKITSAAKSATLLRFDEVLGLDLKKYIAKPIKVPTKVLQLVKAREAARAEKNWKQSDELRDQIKKAGFDVLDTPAGQQLKKN
jgi:cysteinyl-tRNA synthetase